mmetsp:Transcript_19745/g.59799  ORF Transcript_19745/g.59799 Transcript_19745/m.59799 type:complete len:694 (-) Transcript_19745:405-2486(-)
MVFSSMAVRNRLACAVPKPAATPFSPFLTLSSAAARGRPERSDLPTVSYHVRNSGKSKEPEPSSSSSVNTAAHSSGFSGMPSSVTSAWNSEALTALLASSSKRSKTARILAFSLSAAAFAVPSMASWRCRAAALSCCCRFRRRVSSSSTCAMAGTRRKSMGSLRSFSAMALRCSCTCTCTKSASLFSRSCSSWRSRSSCLRWLRRSSFMALFQRAPVTPLEVHSPSRRARMRRSMARFASPRRRNGFFGVYRALRRRSAVSGGPWRPSASLSKNEKFTSFKGSTCLRRLSRSSAPSRPEPREPRLRTPLRLSPLAPPAACCSASSRAATVSRCCCANSPYMMVAARSLPKVCWKNSDAAASRSQPHSAADGGGSSAPRSSPETDDAHDSSKDTRLALMLASSPSDSAPGTSSGSGPRFSSMIFLSAALRARISAAFLASFVFALRFSACSNESRLSASSLTLSPSVSSSVNSVPTWLPSSASSPAAARSSSPSASPPSSSGGGPPPGAGVSSVAPPAPGRVRFLTFLRYCLRLRRGVFAPSSSPAAPAPPGASALGAVAGGVGAPAAAAPGSGGRPLTPAALLFARSSSWLFPFGGVAAAPPPSAAALPSFVPPFLLAAAVTPSRAGAAIACFSSRARRRSLRRFFLAMRARRRFASKSTTLTGSMPSASAFAASLARPRLRSRSAATEGSPW